MFTFEQIRQEQIQAQADLAKTITRRNTWEEVVSGLWASVLKLEAESNLHDFADANYNNRLNFAYQAYDEALETSKNLDDEIEDLEEKIDLLKRLKRYYL